MASGQTYHCICSTLILATKYDIEALPTRKEPAHDQAIILPLSTENGQGPPTSTLHNLLPDATPLIVRREDGFDRRIVLRCSRCKLIIGYKLDQAGLATSGGRVQDVMYILPGGLIPTEHMQQGHPPKTTPWAQKGTD